jgi:hypothetical protein
MHAGRGKHATSEEKNRFGTTSGKAKAVLNQRHHGAGLWRPGVSPKAGWALAD